MTCSSPSVQNVYFRLTTAYDILRHCGLSIGKQDYLGAIPLEGPDLIRWQVTPSSDPLPRWGRVARRCGGQFRAGSAGMQQKEKACGRRDRRHDDQEPAGKSAAVIVSCPRRLTVSSTNAAPSATPVEIDNCWPTATSDVARLMRRLSTSA